MALTTVAAWSVGQRLKAAALNNLVTALQELQAGLAWASITAGSGITAGSPAPRWRQEGDTIRLEGRFSASSPSTWSGTQVLCTLTAAARPVRDCSFNVVGNSTTQLKIAIVASTGVVTATIISGTPNVAVLDGITYPLT
jgi:hypothetical protein